MNDELVLHATVELLEAVSRGAQRAKMERLIHPLEVALRKAFREQSHLLIRKFRQVKRFFNESDPWQGHYDLLTARFSEAVPANEIEIIWTQVVMETLKLFSVPIDAAVAKALELGGIGLLGELGMKVRFDLKNPRAVDYLKDYGSFLVRGVNDETRRQLQTLIAKATDEGWSYQRTAEAIIERFEQFAVGRPQDHIDSRAHLIAVTETGNAYEEGNRIVAKDLQDAGLPMEKSWSTVGDTKVSAGCLQNEADGWIGFDEAHSSGHLNPLRFPGCRCEERYRMKEGVG